MNIFQVIFILVPLSFVNLESANKVLCYLESCDHYCELVNDLPVCRCMFGFRMDEDQKCHLEDTYRNGYLLFTDTVRHPKKHNVTGDVVLQWPLFDTKNGSSPASTATVHAPPVRLRRVEALSWCPRLNETYLLSTIPTNGSNFVFASQSRYLSMTYVFEPTLVKFTHEWVTENGYYALRDLGIGVCGQRHCMAPFIGAPAINTSISKILVHPRRARIFWSEWVESNNTFSVYWAGLDGSREECILRGTGRRVDSLVMDYTREIVYVLIYNKVFFANIGAHFARRNRGGEPPAFCNAINFEPLQVDALKNANSMIVFDRFFYFIDRLSKELKRMPRITAFNKKPEVLTRLNNVNGSVLAIANTVFYEPLWNPCLTKNCSELCVLRPAPANSNDFLFSTVEGLCVCGAGNAILPNGKCISSYEQYRMLVSKATSNSLTINKELQAHRVEMEGGSVGISWALVLTSIPAMIINVLTCLTLIHVIVSDYIQYLRVINQ